MPEDPPSIVMTVDQLGPGSLPSYWVKPGRPVYAIDQDGDNMLRLVNNGRVFLPEFELTSVNEAGMRHQLLDRMIALCQTAGFAGKTVVAVRSQMILMDGKKPMYVFQGAMAFAEGITLGEEEVEWNRAMDDSRGVRQSSLYGIPETVTLENAEELYRNALVAATMYE